MSKKKKVSSILVVVDNTQDNVISIITHKCDER
jgi:hypothetical protein